MQKHKSIEPIYTVGEDIMTGDLKMGKYSPKKYIRCRVCGELFLPTNGNNRICSDSCRDNYYKQKGLSKTYRDGIYIPTGYKQSGSSNNNYRHGVWTKGNIYRDHNTGYCEECGSTENLDVHHIDHDRMNYSQDNLKTLCRSCHKKLHCHRDSSGKFTSSKV